MIRKREGFQGQRAIVLPRSLLATQCTMNPALAPLYITDIGFYDKAKFHYKKRPQGADQHILIYCKEGAGQIIVGGHAHPMQAGNCFLLPRNVPHEYNADARDPWTIYWAHFTGTSSDGLLEAAMKEWQGYKTFLRWSDQRIELFDKSYRQLEKGYRTENLLYANMHFWTFLANCIYSEAELTVAPSHNATDLAISFMRKNLHKMLTLQQMANAANLSQSHFSSLFKAHTGFSPIEYFNQLKVQDACQYLLFTTLRIKEIAARLGMEDPYYFSRLFTKVMSVSPNQYRERNT
ncbi:AraC family transcriptional regulator [Chitinophaga sp. sic0106]|uniref:AraC family transcriptional regulator n=1 Tax=Chitinophaga sp. sic0106 TaxID=2854785 RepID=UPI001C43F41C|nr:AraC family transcriptional regulator [Chitinophaga sp. sic0106]MBV7529232.1 AraC family transcriptional regulator [Chitinophaga sp. sic0106]